jgi:cellulose synthase/poly-beta-1,6-N-acetylglucosamine synthase-like glycosyltransferase
MTVEPATVIGWAMFGCAAVPCLMTAWNLLLYRRPPLTGEPLGVQDRVDVCIPARNEAANIEACVQGVLASAQVPVRACVYDDQSTDATLEILIRLAATDARVIRVPTDPLPAGWNGKQWGCERMGRASDATWLLFTDADVRMDPRAVAAAVRFALRSGSDLVSTFPREVCGSLGEALAVPMIHFVLLGYLPMGFMRRDRRPALAAGCGQFLLVRREVWQRSGGHAAFKASMHDGIKLPRSVRAAGGQTDLFDGTELVSCRMYRGFGQSWRGFVKNAYEGLGSIGTLLFFTTMHVVGHLTPWMIVVVSLAGVGWARAMVGHAALAIALAYLTRLMLAVRFRQPWSAVLLHPVGVALMTAIQWTSLWVASRGRREWKGRVAGA